VITSSTEWPFGVLALFFTLLAARDFLPGFFVFDRTRMEFFTSLVHSQCTASGKQG